MWQNTLLEYDPTSTHKCRYHTNQVAGAHESNDLLPSPAHLHLSQGNFMRDHLICLAKHFKYKTKRIS